MGMSQCLLGTVCFPVIGKMRKVHMNQSIDTYEKNQLLLQALAEFENDLDQLLYSVGAPNVLMIGRLSHSNLPSVIRLQTWYENFKQRMRNEPSYLKKVIEEVPKIVAKTNSEDIMDVIGDDDFLNLIRPN